MKKKRRKMFHMINGTQMTPGDTCTCLVDKIVKKTITEVSSPRPQCSEIWSTVIKGQFTLLTWPEVFTFISTRTKKFSYLGLTWSWPCSAKLNLYTDITKSLRNVREERNRPSSIWQIETFRFQDENGYEYEIWLKVLLRSNLRLPFFFARLAV